MINQLILVYGYDKSVARIKIYKINNKGKWSQTSDTYGFIGKNGLGKTIEGDNKTPIRNF